MVKPATHTLTLGEHTATVRELSVAEVRAWIVEKEQGQSCDGVGELMHPDCALDDLLRMSDLTAEAAEQLTAAQLDQLVRKAKALNPHFFRVRAALNSAVRQLVTETERALSSATPPPLQ